MSNYKFETLQLHVGQGRPVATGSAPCPSPDHFYVFRIASARR